MGKRIDKKKIHIEYSFDFDQYNASFDQSDFLAKLLLNFFQGYPINPKPDLRKLMIEAQNIAAIIAKQMKQATKEELKKHGTIERLAYAKADDFVELDKYPEYLQALGNLFYQAKTAPQKVGDLNNPVNYLDFNWHINTIKIVFNHSYFEAFIAKTIEAICRAKPEIAYEYLESKKNTKDLLKTLSTNELLDLVHKKVRVSLESRIKFLRENCKIDAELEGEREVFILFLEQIRHIIVHHNGIITTLFVKKISEIGLEMSFIKQEVDERIRLTEELSNIQRAVYHFFVAELFKEVCQQYLDIE